MSCCLFQMSTIKGQGECTYDLSHAWPAEHACWNNGAMDSFVSTHTSPSYENQLGTNTMGYYDEHDIPFYYRARSKLHDLRQLLLLGTGADASESSDGHFGEYRPCWRRGRPDNRDEL